MEQWLLLENISRKQSLNLVWFDKRKEIEITRDQEFDEIEGRRKNIERRIENGKDTRKIE